MKIPEPLPQFDDRRTLLLIASRQAAGVYLAHKGILEEFRSIKITNPLHSDREGFFTTSGKGTRMGSGSVYESKTYTAQKIFLNKLEAAVADAMRRRRIRAVHLFAPEPYAAAIEAALPSKAKDMLERTHLGNYVKLGPIEALEKMFQKRTAQRTGIRRALAPKKAKKVLRKSRQARRVVGK